MKLAILSCNSKCYSTARLREAAEERGHKVKVLNTLRFSIDVEAGEPDLSFRSKPLSNYDAVLPRIGASITFYGTAVVRQFEQMDVYCANSSAVISFGFHSFGSIKSIEMSLASPCSNLASSGISFSISGNGSVRPHHRLLKRRPIFPPALAA